MEPILPLQQASSLRRYTIRFLIIFVIVLIGLFIFINDSPSDFQPNTMIRVLPNETWRTLAQDLKDKNLIRSKIYFKILVILSARERGLVTGDYLFKQPISTLSLTSRLVKGNFDLVPIRLTIPEGITISEISKIVSEKFTNISAADFKNITKDKEGYLFPDTYLFLPGISAEAIVSAMERNFDEKIKIVQAQITASGHSQKDVIIMASILEEEGSNVRDWKIISGILWKRIKLSMPLQVDASLGYVTGKASSELTMADLKMTSPYNTYTNRGLPPAPISNPGLQTIEAAANPTQTSYLYYLSDKNGDIHYATTFAEHVKNKEKYLK